VQDRIKALPPTTNSTERIKGLYQLRQEAGATQDGALRYALLTEAAKLATASEQITLLVQLSND